MENWQRQEKEIKRKHKGRLTPGSGNKSIKGDVIAGAFVIEAKHRTSVNNKGAYITLEMDWLRELNKQKKIPILNLNFNNEVSYNLIREKDYRDLAPNDLAPDLAKRITLETKQARLFFNQIEDCLLITTEGNWLVLTEQQFLSITKDNNKNKEVNKKCWNTSNLYSSPEKKLEQKQKLRELRKKLYKQQKETLKSSKLSKTI